MATHLSIQNLVIVGFYTCYAFFFYRYLAATYRHFFPRANAYRHRLTEWLFRGKSSKFPSLMKDEEASWTAGETVYAAPTDQSSSEKSTLNADDLPRMHEEASHNKPLEIKTSSSFPSLVKYEYGSRIAGETVYTTPTQQPFSEKQALEEWLTMRENASSASPIAVSPSPLLSPPIPRRFYAVLLLSTPLHVALCVFSLLPTTLLTLYCWAFMGLVYGLVYTYGTYVSWRTRVHTSIAHLVFVIMFTGYWIYFFLSLVKLEKLPDGSGRKLDFSCWGLASALCEPYDPSAGDGSSVFWINGIGSLQVTVHE